MTVKPVHDASDLEYTRTGFCQMKNHMSYLIKLLTLVEALVITATLTAEATKIQSRSTSPRTVQAKTTVAGALAN